MNAKKQAIDDAHELFFLYDEFWKLYDETAESLAERMRRNDLRRWGTEPASTLKGRPTKRDRRLLENLPVDEPDASHDDER